MDCKDLFIAIQEEIKSQVEYSLNTSFYTEITAAFSFCEDLKVWSDFIDKKYSNELFRLASMEYETAIMFSLQTLYKQAFTALRACLEHTLFGIQLTTNLLQYNLWKNEKKDVYWSNIVDNESGLFSPDYINAFAKDLQGSATLIGNLAKQVYRECSEYTHGNYKVAVPLLTQLEYDEQRLESFLETAKTLRYILEYSLFARFHGELCISDMEKLEPQISERLCHIAEINEFLMIKRMGV